MSSLRTSTEIVPIQFGLWNCHSKQFFGGIEERFVHYDSVSGIDWDELWTVIEYVLDAMDVENYRRVQRKEGAGVLADEAPGPHYITHTFFLRPGTSCEVRAWVAPSRARARKPRKN